jgi:tripartite ATP-independent transporter DctP family solute receptor
MRPRTLLLWFALPLALLLHAGWRAVSGDAATARVLLLGHALSTTHPVHHGMQVFADEVARRSGGRLKVEIHADGKLGNERELLELLQIGSIAVTKVSAGQLEAFAPAFGVLGLPYVFDDGAHFWRFAESPEGRALLASAIPRRIHGLAWYDAGARSFYLSPRSGRTVRSPADLAGLSIRVMPSRAALAMVEALGAKPVPIPFGELYTALDAGTVDGAENNPPSLFASRQYEVAASYSLTEHLILPDVLVIGSATWQRLDADERGWIEAAAAVSSQAQRVLWAAEEARNLVAMATAGLEVVRDVDRAAFRRATAAVHADAANAGAERQALLAAIRRHAGTGGTP